MLSIMNDYEKFVVQKECWYSYNQFCIVSEGYVFSRNPAVKKGDNPEYLIEETGPPLTRNR